LDKRGVLSGEGHAEGSFAVTTDPSADKTPTDGRPTGVHSLESAVDTGLVAD